MNAHDHLNSVLAMAEEALDMNHGPVPLHMEEREQIERDLNLIEAKRALVDLIDDATADNWSTTDIHNLQAALSTVERKT